MKPWLGIVAYLLVIFSSPGHSKVLEEFPVSRADFEVTAPYPALFFWHVVCVLPNGSFKTATACKPEPMSPKDPNVSDNIHHLSFNCGVMYSAAGYRWNPLPTPSILTLTEDSAPNFTPEQYAIVVVDCGRLAATIADLPPDQRERSYAACREVTNQHLGHCFVLTKTPVGYLIGYGVFQLTMEGYDKPWTPDATQLLPNTVCIETDQEAHPISECPGVPLEKINDCAFPPRQPQLPTGERSVKERGRPMHRNVKTGTHFRRRAQRTACVVSRALSSERSFESSITGTVGVVSRYCGRQPRASTSFRVRYESPSGLWPGGIRDRNTLFSFRTAEIGAGERGGLKFRGLLDCVASVRCYSSR